MNNNFVHEITADEFLNASDVVIEKVPTPEIGAGSFIYARSLRAGDRGRIDAQAAKFKTSNGKNTEDIQDFNVNLVFRGACNVKGERLFTDIKQVAVIKERNAAMVSRIAEVVARLSGLSKEDLEELEKNSGKVQQDALLTD